MDRDGRLEFYVAFQEGLARVDEDGNIQWMIGKDDWYGHVEVCDASAQNEGAIVAMPHYDGGYGTILEVRDERGSLLNHLRPSMRIAGDYQVLRWPLAGEGILLLAHAGYLVVLFDQRGKPVITYQVPTGYPVIYFVECSMLRMADGQQYLAILVGFSRISYRGSLLVILGPDGTVLYEEGMEYTRALSAVDVPGEDGEALLVGSGEHGVSIYRRAARN